jgi:hypothetical protein
MLQASIRMSNNTFSKKLEKQKGCNLTLSIGLWDDASSDADGSSTITEELAAPQPEGESFVAMKQAESVPAALNLDLTISSTWLA